jgi:3-phosphoshikimate 1-carboxyvinyltransferase
MQIELPISKSIANRLLILQAIHGDELMPVSATFPDDVQIMSEAIRLLGERREARIDLGNCGTAMRFLTAYCAQLDGQTTILDGVERMHHRPIGQLVDALREIGADIEYLGEEGFPPLRIKGCILDKHRIVTINNPQSTQFVSALLLIGANIQTDSTSPYITLTRALIEQYISCRSQGVDCERNVVENNVGGVVGLNNLESDWSSAAFWYEYIAIHSGKIHLPGLFRDSIQGDKVVADIFAQLGVQTQYTTEGVTIISTGVADLQRSDLQGIVARSTAQRSAEEILHQDFSACPDLYPAVALTCERLGIELHATGVESLPLKESDRLRAVAEHRTDADHRMAMALLIAGYEVDDIECISKSYPQFLEQFHRINTLKLQ